MSQISGCYVPISLRDGRWIALTELFVLHARERLTRGEKWLFGNVDDCHQQECQEFITSESKLTLELPWFAIDPNDRKPLGRTGEKISAIGLGTWAIKNYRSAEKTLIKAIELGLDLVDTAEMYGDGAAEELVGRVLKKVKKKEGVFITTKLLPHRFSDPREAVKAAERSLKRLGVGTVDLILIHWPDERTPIRKQIRALEGLAERGYCRYIGVSNFDAEQLSEAIQSVRKYDLVVDQVKYSILDRRVETELLPLTIREGITVQAYTPLERGRVATIELLRKLGKRYEKTAVQVALNFLISRPGVVAIPKTERPERVEELAGALGWRLSPEDLELVERIS